MPQGALPYTYEEEKKTSGMTALSPAFPSTWTLRRLWVLATASEDTYT